MAKVTGEEESGTRRLAPFDEEQASDARSPIAMPCPHHDVKKRRRLAAEAEAAQAGIAVSVVLLVEATSRKDSALCATMCLLLALFCVAMEETHDELGRIRTT